MSKLNVTHGEWKISQYTNCNVQNEKKRAVCTTAVFSTNTDDGQHQMENEANAILIADAGTTYNKCGLLSSELMEQNEELKATLTKLMEGNMCSVVGEEIIQEILTKHSKQ